MNQQAECCPRFDPTPWDGTQVDFEGALFLRDKVRSFLHLPLNFGSVMKRAQQLIEANQAKGAKQVILVDENSLWGSDVYIQVTHPIPHAQMSLIKGSFVSKAFEGPYSKIGQFVAQMKDYLQQQGARMNGLLYYYPLCPRCAQKYGHNYVVLLASAGGEGLKIETLKTDGAGT